MGMDGGGFAQRDAYGGVPIEVCGRRGGDLHVLQQLRHLELRTRRRLRGRVGLRVGLVRAREFRLVGLAIEMSWTGLILTLGFRI